MSGPSRRVGTVRLAARSEALVRRGALLLEDALRTASLPEAGPGRVLLIRSLSLGVIRGHLPPSSLALLLERRVRELARSAVPADHPSAEQAPAVFFRDDAQPGVMLAGRLARGEPVSAWFWPLAVPDVLPAPPRDQALRHVLATVLQTSAGPAAGMRLLESLHEEGGLDVLLEALRLQEGPALLQAFGSPSPVPAPSAPAGPLEPPETALPSPPLRERVTRWVRAWGAGDARSVWLTAMALVLGRKGHLSDTRLFARAARLAAALESGRPGGGRDAPAGPEGARTSATVLAEGQGLSPSAPRRPGPSVTRLAEGPRGAAQGDGTPPLATPPFTAPGPRSSAREALPETTPEGEEKPLRPWPEVPRPTEAGGLLFLLPILGRLGIATLLEEYPALLKFDVPDRLLARIAERLGVSATDPSRIIFEAHVLGGRPAHGPFALPERLRRQVADTRGPLRALPTEGPAGRLVLTDASRRLPLAVTYGTPLAPWPGPREEDDDLELLLRGLRTALRRWCRRQVRMGLHTLVRRPARITATRTHVDVLFDLQQADLRVRGAGLDVDPGWVPWLGRVVRFHYLHGEG